MQSRFVFQPTLLFHSVAIIALLANCAHASKPPSRVALELSPTHFHDCTLKSISPDEWEITTTGPDPQLYTIPIPALFDPTQHHIIEFEYTSPTGASNVQVFLIPPGDETHSTTGPGLKPAESWCSYALDLKPSLDRTRRKPTSLRIDLGNKARQSIKLRAIALRELSEPERAAQRLQEQERAESSGRDSALLAYLNKQYPGAITRVEVTAEAIKIAGRHIGDTRDLFLAELAASTTANMPGVFLSTTLLPVDAQGNFALTLPRLSGTNDRLLSRWAILRKRSGEQILESAARWADGVQPEWDAPIAKPSSKKGLGGFHAGGNAPVTDLDDLGISSVTVNVQLNDLFRATPGPGRAPFDYARRTFYVQEARLAALDRTLEEAARRKAVVSAIILIGQGAKAPDKSWGSLIAHPDADPGGTFVMPNLTNEEGIRAYAAALDFLAKRYMGVAGKFAHGRIHHWIMHNEVDAGWTWTNAGEKSAAQYMELYHKSMRIAHLIARQYDSHSKAFISLDHHWAASPGPHCHPSRDLLDLLVSFSHAEGDFEWGIAHHPYPQDLFNPRVWEDTQAKLSFDTPKITMKNIEVLDQWVRQPRAMYLGKTPRSIHLTEQGFNSRDYSDKFLTDQAAGMIYTWKKIQQIDSIESFDYHNWIDNRHEGGLRIGLRKFPDDADAPLGIKPIWNVYRALGTPAEDQATAFAKPIIGVKGWSEVKLGAVTEKAAR